MRLDQELVTRKLCDTRTEAQELISNGFVFVDNLVCQKQTRLISESNTIEVTKRREFVSRGGEKLRGALTHIYHNDDCIRQFCSNKSVLDIGASTGGFTDCVLSYGASSVDAVDVGTAQLHIKIKNNDKVVSFENTDIRDFKPNKKYDIIVADLSFISLENIFPLIISFGGHGAAFFLLIKPQFEVGKGNTKKGIVKDEGLVVETLLKYENSAHKEGLKEVSVFKCSIQGGDGNQEYFLFGKLS